MEQKIKEWLTTKAHLDRYKKLERTLRDQIAQEVLGAETGKASQKFGELVAKVEIKLNYKIIPDVLISVWGDMSPEERLCIRNKPELALKNYKALSADSVLHRAVETKPAAPSLKVSVEETL